MIKHNLLGDITPSKFLKEYWHKKPLLIRQAIPSFNAPVSCNDLFSLAARDDVESRLITNFRNKWALQSGPFDSMPAEKRKWTLLVQGVNLHHAEAERLLEGFRFIPDTRLDDLMISYASDGGGVGPHFDTYDVFLLQAHGKRHWRIGAQKDLSLVPNLPLKILRDFRPDQEFVLEPGDMLYLPPHYAHDGIAIGECMTYSIGFRAPSFQELGEAFLQFMSEELELKGRYADPALKPTSHPAKIDNAMIEQIASRLLRLKASKKDLEIFLGEYFSEPKPTVYFSAPERPKNFERFQQGLHQKGLRLSAKTRMLYRGKTIFINGESFTADRSDVNWLGKLADARECPPGLDPKLSSDLLETLYDWYRSGWIEIK